MISELQSMPTSNSSRRSYLIGHCLCATIHADGFVEREIERAYIDDDILPGNRLYVVGKASQLNDSMSERIDRNRTVCEPAQLPKVKAIEAA